MTVQELIARFREIPQDLHGEPLLAQCAGAFGDLLKIAQEPSACSTQYNAGNHYYLKLIGPLSIYGYRLCSREDVLKQLQDLLDQHQADPVGFAASLLPSDTPAKEVKGPGCS